MTKRNKPSTPYEPPADKQIITWIEDQGRPVILAIFDEMIEPSNTTQRDTYKAFVQRFGSRAAEMAVRLYQTKQAGRGR